MKSFCKRAPYHHIVISTYYDIQAGYDAERFYIRMLNRDRNFIWVAQYIKHGDLCTQHNEQDSQKNLLVNITGTCGYLCTLVAIGYPHCLFNASCAYRSNSLYLYDLKQTLRYYKSILYASQVSILRQFPSLVLHGEECINTISFPKQIYGCTALLELSLA